MKNEKSIRHEVMDKVRNELKSTYERHTILYQLIFDEIDKDKRDLYIQAIQKKDYVFGLGYLYTRLAQLIRLKDNRTANEEKFLEFAKKNKLI